ncbi:hypothetical protein ACGTN9_10075 [Halobacillus sp. MO56]
MKRKALRDGALTNNQTPTESLPERESKETFTDVDAAKAQERAKIADREELEGKK